MVLLFSLLPIMSKSRMVDCLWLVLAISIFLCQNGLCYSPEDKLEATRQAEPRIVRTICASEKWALCLTASGLGTPDDTIQLKHTDNSKFVMDGEMLNEKSITVQAVEPYEDDSDILMVVIRNADTTSNYLVDFQMADTKSLDDWTPGQLSSLFSRRNRLGKHVSKRAEEFLVRHFTEFFKKK